MLSHMHAPFLVKQRHLASTKIFASVTDAPVIPEAVPTTRGEQGRAIGRTAGFVFMGFGTLARMGAHLNLNQDSGYWYAHLIFAAASTFVSMELGKVTGEAIGEAIGQNLGEVAGRIIREDVKVNMRRGSKWLLHVGEELHFALIAPDLIELLFGFESHAISSEDSFGILF